MKKSVVNIIILYIVFVLLKSLLVYFIPAPSAFSDGYIYAEMAQNFFHTGQMLVYGTPVYFYPPIYAMFLSISYLFNDMTVVYLVMKVINVLLSTSIIFPTYLLAKEFLSTKKSFITAMLVGVLPSTFAFSSFLMAENLFYPLFMFSIYFVYKSFTSNARYWDLFAGVFIGLTYLTKTLGIVLVPLVILMFLFNLSWQQSVKKVLMGLVCFLTVLPWYIGKTSIVGGYSAEIVSINSGNLYVFLTWIVLYLAYLVLSSGVVLFAFSLLNLKTKNKKLKVFMLMFVLVLGLVLFVAANHNVHALNTSDLELGEFYRSVGRYVEVLLPLLVIGGMIGYQNYKKKKYLPYFVPAVLALTGSFLIYFQMFPINNMSLVWLGVSNLIFKYLGIPLLLGSVTLIFFLLLDAYLAHKLKMMKLFPIILFTYFLCFSCVNIAGTYYNSQTYWLPTEHTQLGLWFNDYDQEYSNILFDEDYEGVLTKTEQDSLYELHQRNVKSTIIGFWLNDNVIISNINNLENIDYVVTKKDLSLPLIKETENGIHIYKNI
ncbi:MAG: glycosyltransferase family 39 protein [archaeon]